MASKSIFESQKKKKKLSLTMLRSYVSLCPEEKDTEPPRLLQVVPEEDTKLESWRIEKLHRETRAVTIQVDYV